MLPNYRERTTKVAPFFYSLRLSQSALGVFGLNTGVRGNPPKLNRNFQRLPFGGQIWHPYRPKSATRRARGLPSERSAGLAEKRLQPENNRTRRFAISDSTMPPRFWAPSQSRPLPAVLIHRANRPAASCARPPKNTEHGN